jgi:hypothetical protein
MCVHNQEGAVADGATRLAAAKAQAKAEGAEVERLKKPESGAPASAAALRAAYGHADACARVLRELVQAQ